MDTEEITKIPSVEKANELANQLEIYLAVKHIQTKGVLPKSLGASINDEAAIIVRKCVKAYLRNTFPTAEVRMLSRGISVSLIQNQASIMNLALNCMNPFSDQREMLLYVPEVKPHLEALINGVSALTNSMTVSVVPEACNIVVNCGLDTLRGKRGTLFDYLYMIVAGVEQFKTNIDNLMLNTGDIAVLIERGRVLKEEAERARASAITREMDDILTRLTGVTYGTGLIQEGEVADTTEVEEAAVADVDVTAEDAQEEGPVTVREVVTRDGQHLEIQTPVQGRARAANGAEMARLQEIMRRQGLV